MSTFTTILHDKLLTIYDKYMLLKIYVDTNDDILKQKYISTAETRNHQFLENPHMIDAGVDLFMPGSPETIENNKMIFRGQTNKLDHHIICSAKMFTDAGKSYNTGYYLHPRSSISKTRLRLANSTGIIDAGYRGHIIGMMDILPTDTIHKPHIGEIYDRYIQICAPSLVPIVVQVVDTFEELGEETTRGAGAFGSTGR